jgi:hypothetical protein
MIGGGPSLFYGEIVIIAKSMFRLGPAVSCRCGDPIK